MTRERSKDELSRTAYKDLIINPAIFAAEKANRSLERRSAGLFLPSAIAGPLKTDHFEEDHSLHAIGLAIYEARMTDFPTSRANLITVHHINHQIRQAQLPRCTDCLEDIRDSGIIEVWLWGPTKTIIHGLSEVKAWKFTNFGSTNFFAT